MRSNALESDAMCRLYCTTFAQLSLLVSAKEACSEILSVVLAMFTRPVPSCSASRPAAALQATRRLGQCDDCCARSSAPYSLLSHFFADVHFAAAPGLPSTS